MRAPSLVAKFAFIDGQQCFYTIFFKSRIRSPKCLPYPWDTNIITTGAFRFSHHSAYWAPSPRRTASSMKTITRNNLSGAATQQCNRQGLTLVESGYCNKKHSQLKPSQTDTVPVGFRIPFEVFSAHFLCGGSGRKGRSAFFR